MKNSTKRRSVLGRTLMLIGSMFAMGAVAKGARGKSNPTMAAGLGWGSGAIYSPRKGKHKGYMRSETYQKKHKR